jgi:hypothetical protein
VCGLDSSGLEYSPVAGFCEHGSETSGSVKGVELSYKLIVCQLLKEDSVARN